MVSSLLASFETLIDTETEIFQTSITSLTTSVGCSRETRGWPSLAPSVTLSSFALTDRCGSGG